MQQTMNVCIHTLSSYTPVCSTHLLVDIAPVGAPAVNRVMRGGSIDGWLAVDGEHSTAIEGG